jgi:hypothetical protein
MTESGARGTVLVNVAAWDGPADIPEGWKIANAPRPLAGERTWDGQFRHGIFYAAAPQVVGGTFGWAADDAWPVEFIDNAEITRRVLAKFATYGYASAEDAGVTIAEQAYCMQLPWHEG